MRIVLMWRGALAAVGCLALCACSGSSTSSRPHVVASAYPFAFVVGQLAGDFVEVEDLTPTGAEPHDIELTPRQIADLTDARLVVIERGFQAAVDDALTEVEPDVAVLDVADTVPLAGSDPHVWLDPVRMVAITRAVEASLIQVFPDQEEQVRTRAGRLVTQLQRLDEAYAAGLAQCARRTFVTSHDAFGYLADRYDLRMVPVAGLDPQQEPSPAQQATIADTVESAGVTTIFTEPLASSAVAQSIADETGTRLATLDPVEGLADDSADDDYLALMYDNLAALEVANGCR